MDNVEPLASSPKARPSAALMFVVDEAEMPRLQRELDDAPADDRARALAALSWHLRQRDGRRASTLALQARAQLEGSSLAPADRQRLAVRLTLVEAEVHWQFAEYDQARALADQALAEAARLGDTVAGADAHWLLATLSNDVGDIARRDASYQACEAHAEMAGDRQRALVARAAMARWSVFTDPSLARRRWGDAFGDGSGPWPPGVGTWVLDFLGNLAFSDGDYSPATMYRLRMHEDAVATGQWQRAIIALTNIGACFSNLNDHETGLAWMQRGLDEARRLGWPAAIAVALLQVGGVLQPLGRLDAAHELLREASAMPGIPRSSRTHVMALQYLGDVLNAQGRHAEAIEVLAELEARSEVLQQSDIPLEARLARAVSLASLGRLDEALAIAQSTLERCRQHQRRSIEIKALMELARLHSMRRDLAMGADERPGVVLHCLREALSLATSIDGYQVTGELYDALAREHARAGDWQAAYEVSLQAARAREKTTGAAALNRSIAMQIGFQTERARADAEHHRSLADMLQQTTSTLERLGAIGQEITRHLDERAVLEVLRRHVDGLLDATHFSVWMLDEEGGEPAMRLAFGVEGGVPLVEGMRIPLADPSSNVARCARTGDEIVRDEALPGPNPNQIPGTLPSSSVLFAPLVTGTRRMGVMSIQSPHAHAYGERERLIFRTLCAYGAIGLSNSRAYHRLAGALDELQHARDELATKNEQLEQAWRQQQEASLTDPLTQLRNRRFLMAHIEDEVALTLRRQEQRQRRASDAGGAEADDRDLVFFMVDIDHFKSINDQHGHAAGDRVLVQVAQRLREVARETDYLIRWGGEEFLIVARATHAEDGAALAERLRRAIALRPFDLGDGASVTRTCSIGYAAFPFHRDEPRMAGWSEVAKLADQALYLAKEEGRDRWVGLHSAGHVPARDEFEAACRDPLGAVRRGVLAAVRGGA